MVRKQYICKSQPYKLGTLSLILILASCSAERKCQRKIKRALPCMEYKSDTIVQFDTIEGFVYDTFFVGKKTIDTFYQDSGGIQVKTIVKWKDRIVNQTLTKRDTIIESKIITNTPKPIIKNKIPSWIKGLLISLSSFIALLLILIKKGAKFNW